MHRAFSLVAVCLILALPAEAQLMGRVVGGGAELIDVVVSLERETGQIIHQVFTSSRGTFRIEGVDLFSVSNNNPVHLVIRHEGYKTYSRRLQQMDFRGGGSVFTVYLEPAESNVVTVGGEDGDHLTVDVRQLQVEIPEEALTKYEAALEDSAGGDHERAIRRLEQVVELAPDYYDAWIDLGGEYNRLGRVEDAKAAYLEAGEVNPAGALAPLNLGALYYQQGELQRAEGSIHAFDTYSQAEEWLERAIELNPGGSGGYYLGATLYRLNRLQEAEDMLRNAMATDNGSPEAQIVLINVYVRMNRYHAALDEAIAFLDDYPDAPERDAIERVRAQIEGAIDR